MLKKLPLWAKIFIGMGLGILFGLISVWVEWETFTTNWVKPWGTIFLKLLKLIAVPLIFVSLVKGISSLTDITKLSRIGYKTIVIYLITTVFATTVGLAMVNIFKPGDVFPESSTGNNSVARWKSDRNRPGNLRSSPRSSFLRI